jgi:hypothetical protein
MTQGVPHAPQSVCVSSARSQPSPGSWLQSAKLGAQLAMAHAALTQA